MSSLMQIIAYIKLPTIDAYDTLDMCLSSSFVWEDCLFENFEWVPKGVFLVLAFQPLIC